MHDDDLQDRTEPRRRRDRDDYDDDGRPRLRNFDVVNDDDDRARPRQRDRKDEADDRDRDDVRVNARFPSTVMTAGIIWIVLGSLILIGAGMILIPALILSKSLTSAGTVGIAFVFLAIFVGLFGGAFLFVGVQSVRGTATDTLGNGIGSIIFAAIVFGGAIMQINGGQEVYGFIALLESAGLILAGATALIGRRQYKDWKRSRRRRR